MKIRIKLNFFSHNKLKIQPSFQKRLGLKLTDLL